jgi:hypothetical protein
MCLAFSFQAEVFVRQPTAWKFCGNGLEYVEHDNREILVL